jgi:hypothetical protein
MNEETVLAAIGSTEETSFNEFCRALGDDCPESGNRNGWREVLSHLGTLERHGFIEISRTQGKIDAMILTAAGANRIRENLDRRRGLLSALR